MGGKKREDVLVLFSGGRDSFLTTCHLIEDDCKALMVTFDNGAGLAGKNAKHGARRIIGQYGKESAQFLGVYSTAGLWREFMAPYNNMKPSEVIGCYGELPYSQFNCLTCRSAMYTWVILKARELGVRYAADGARSNQRFVIELPCMTERFEEFFRSFGMEIMFPVQDLEYDWRLKNLLLGLGFVPKVLEPQCILGTPLEEDLEENVKEAVVAYFDQIIFPKARELVEMGFPIKARAGELL